MKDFWNEREERYKKKKKSEFQFNKILKCFLFLNRYIKCKGKIRGDNY